MRQIDRPPVGFTIKLVLQVFAGGCRPRLGVDPSRPYFCESFPGCLAPYPGGSLGALLVSSLGTSAFPALGRVGFPCPLPARRLQCGTPFRDCRHLLTNVQTSGFARHPGRSHRCGSIPRRAAMAFTSGHRAVSLFPHSGYATRLNRGIGGRGLPPPRFAVLSAAPLTTRS